MAGMAAVAQKQWLARAFAHGPRTPELRGLIKSSSLCHPSNAWFDKRRAFSNAFRVLHPESMTKHGKIAVSFAATCSDVIRRNIKTAHLNSQSGCRSVRPARSLAAICYALERALLERNALRSTSRRRCVSLVCFIICCTLRRARDTRDATRAHRVNAEVALAHSSPARRRELPERASGRTSALAGDRSGSETRVEPSGGPKSAHLWHAFVQRALQTGRFPPLYVMSNADAAEAQVTCMNRLVAIDGRRLLASHACRRAG